MKHLSLRELYANGLANRGNPLFIKAVIEVDEDSSGGLIHYHPTVVGRVCNALIIIPSIFVNGFEDAKRDFIRYTIEGESTGADAFTSNDKVGKAILGKR